MARQSPFHTTARAERETVFRRRRLTALGLLVVATILVIAIASWGGGSSEGPGFAERATEGAAGPAAEPVRFTVAATGDFLIHGPVYERA